MIMLHNGGRGSLVYTAASSLGVDNLHAEKEEKTYCPLNCQLFYGETWYCLLYIITKVSAEWSQPQLKS